jgi:hypothetical protein
MTGNADVASKRELLWATASFAVLAVLVAAFMRPLGAVGWMCLAGSVAFAVLGGLAMWKQRASATRERDGPAVGRRVDRVAAAAAPEELISGARSGEPAPEERRILETALDALVEAGALAPGEVDAALLWRAAQHVDPGCPVGFREALYAFATLTEFGLIAPRRLAFVPVQTEYDAALLAAITASILTALGHRVGPDDVTVALPAGGAQGRASIAFPLDGRRETVACDFLWKYPPPDLCAALAGFRHADDPRELVCADVDYGTLLLAAIRPGGLDALNRHFPAEYPLFGPP